jgi:hypothetical protein
MAITIRGRMGNPSGLHVGPTPAPVVGAAVRLNGLTGFRGVEFLVDTGASNTILHPRDAIMVWDGYLNHDFIVDPSLDHSGGVGGLAQHITREATIVFLRDDGLVDQLVIPVSIARLVRPDPLTGQPGNLSLPSLLGRDVLRYYELRVTNSDVTLTREVSGPGSE